MTEYTRPDTDQVKFSSAKTGLWSLDQYLQDAELGNRTIAQLLQDLFDAQSGVLKPVAVAHVYVDKFIGDGTAFAFSLSAVPVSTKNVQVSVNGLIKTPTDDYYVTGGSLFFVSPPANNSVILARHYQALSESSGAYTNVTNVFTNNQSVAPVVLTSSGGVVAVNAALSNNFTHTLTENTQLANPTNLSDGMHLFYRFKQHASAAKQLTFGSMYKFDGGVNPTMPTGLSKRALLSGYYNAADNLIDCVWSGVAGY